MATQLDIAQKCGIDVSQQDPPSRHPRKMVEVAVEMTIYRTDGTIFSSGSAGDRPAAAG